MTTRRQLALFPPTPANGAIEQIRQLADPVQFAKIPAHITLCYDDEIQDWDYVAKCLEAFDREAIEFSFTIGAPRRFEAEGKGIYLSMTEQGGFYGLARARLLATSSCARRQVKPHVTLLHPKHAANSTDGWTLVDSITFPERIVIHQISLIELRESRWTVIHSYGRKEPHQSPEPTAPSGSGSA